MVRESAETAIGMAAAPFAEFLRPSRGGTRSWEEVHLLPAPVPAGVFHMSHGGSVRRPVPLDTVALEHRSKRRADLRDGTSAAAESRYARTHPCVLQRPLLHAKRSVGPARHEHVRAAGALRCRCSRNGNGGVGGAFPRGG